MVFFSERITNKCYSSFTDGHWIVRVEFNMLSVHCTHRRHYRFMETALLFLRNGTSSQHLFRLLKKVQKTAMFPPFYGRSTIPKQAHFCDGYCIHCPFLLFVGLFLLGTHILKKFANSGARPTKLGRLTASNMESWSSSFLHTTN